MTFPAIIEATQSTLAGVLALIVGIGAAWLGGSLFSVAAICCIVVLVSEFFLV